MPKNIPEHFCLIVLEATIESDSGILFRKFLILIYIQKWKSNSMTTVP